jgi:hypothetical protein
VDSVEDFMKHVVLSFRYRKGFSKDTLKTMLTNFINTNFGTNKKEIRKFFENISYAVTGSKAFFGTFTILDWETTEKQTAINFWCNSCYRSLHLNLAFDFSKDFESFLLYAKELRNEDFNNAF